MELAKMLICYYTDITNELTTRLTRISIASVRKNIPHALILLIYPDWHELDEPLIKLADEYDDISNLEKNTHYDYRRCLANGHVQHSALFLDTDTIIQKDVSDVFEDFDFNVAPTLREKPLEPLIPYNMGVCFSRKPTFWEHIALKIGRGQANWRDCEIAFSSVCKMTAAFKIKSLSGRIYNHTPSSKTEDVSNAAIVHYKGQRKNWMLAREKEFGL